MASHILTDKNTQHSQQYYEHPLIKSNLIEWREYQVSIAEVAYKQNTLVVLPTALGKTIIGLFTLTKILEEAPQSKILILAPTRPLVVQHYNSFQQFLDPKIKCCLFSSNLSPLKRAIALNDNHIFFSTPEIIQNDLKNNLYSLEGVGQIIFDETHKARKKYAYTFVSQQYLEQCQHPIILGLTASPGKDLFRINELCETLKIEQIIFRDLNSADVKEFTYPINSIFHRIELPDEIMKSQLILDTAIRKIRDYLVQHEILPTFRYTSKFHFIQLLQDLKTLDLLLDKHYIPKDPLFHEFSDSQELNFPHLLDLFESKIDSTSSSIQKSAILNKAINGIYLEHLKEILTTQDVRLFRNYIDKLTLRANNNNKSIERLLNSKAIHGIQTILKSIKLSPKITKLKTILEQEFKTDSQAKIIIFTQYREMGRYLVEAVNKMKIFRSNKQIFVKAHRFVGQASRENDKGLTQRDQSMLIKQFSENQFNVLIATSVAEEGLDIPNVNAVVFYDSVPSEIRLIQRRGRTGRHQIGHCHFLVANNTLDEIYHNVCHRRETKMSELLQRPGAVTTIPNLSRSKAKPKHTVESYEQVKQRISQLKENKKERKIEEVNNLIQQQKAKIKNIPDNDAFQYLSQYTPSFFGTNSPSFKMPKSYTKTKNIPPIKDNTKITKVTSQSIEKSTLLTKWIFNWIHSTMKSIGFTSSGSLYCDLDDLFSAAEEEMMDLLKIEQEIDKGLKHKIFLVKNSQIIYKYN